MDYLTLMYTLQAAEKDGAGGGGGAGTESPGKDKEAKTPSEEDLKKKQEPEGKDKAADDDDSDGGKKKPIMLPKGRVDEMVAKERAKAAAAEERARQLEAELAKSRRENENEITKLQKKLDELEDLRDDALTDGDRKRAQELRRQIRQIEGQLYDAQMERKALIAKETAKEEIFYNQLLSRYEQEYDEINPESEDFDEELAADMADYVTAKISKGMSAAEALRAAVSRFLGEPKRSTKEESTERARDERGRFTRERVADASRRQPPDLRDVGKDHDRAGGSRTTGKSVMEMTQEEFARLTEEEKARLRGDFLS